MDQLTLCQVPVTFEDAEEGGNIWRQWSKTDKGLFLECIRSVGSNDPVQIAEYLGEVDPGSIVKVINYFKVKAQRSIEPVVRKRKNPEVLTPAPLSSWIKLLTNKLQLEDLNCETSTALRMIGLFEQFPKASETGGVNFKDIYLELANIIDGKPLNVNGNTKFVLEKCVIETALYSKSYIERKQLQPLLDTISVDKNTPGELSRKTNDLELLTLQHLLTQKAYNPLSVPESALKSCN